MALMQITLIPLGRGESVGEYIADTEHYLRQRNISHTLHDMGTIVHGPVEELLQLAGQLHRLPFNRGARRVITHITIDDRRDAERKLGEKKQAVLDLLEDSGQVS